MGLDAVELMMEIEDRFEITIPDARYEGIVTVGNLCDVILVEIEHQRGLRLTRWFDVFDALVPVICAVLNVPANEVSVDAKLMDDLGMY